MEGKIMRELLMQLLRESKSNSWVADQLGSTFAQSISMTVKDIGGDAEFYRLVPSDIPAREKKKRETYETTRAFTDEEALDVIKKAFRTVFVDLPAIQGAALRELHAFGIDFDDIEFVAPDEPGREDAPHTLESSLQDFSEKRANDHVENFFDRAEE